MKCHITYRIVLKDQFMIINYHNNYYIDLYSNIFLLEITDKFKQQYYEFLYNKISLINSI